MNSQYLWECCTLSARTLQPVGLGCTTPPVVKLIFTEFQINLYIRRNSLASSTRNFIDLALFIDCCMAAWNSFQKGPC